MKIKTLYQDTNILAIDKPAGVLVDEVIEKYPKYILAHRLDRETSGVLLLAKNTKAHEFLKKQFQGRTIKKIYNTVVSGHMKNDHGIIKKPIGRSPKDFRRYLAGRGARGELRESETFFKVLKRFEDKKIKFTYLEVRPKTGRTHQIRVHMKYLNHPVVGDELYNPDSVSPTGIKRMMLHALSIEFNNLKDKLVKVESSLPAEFKKVLKLK